MNEIDFIGYDGIHPKDFFYSIPEGYDHYLLILTASAAEFLIDGDMLPVPTGHAILYSPGQKIYYRAAGTEYQNDWIRFHSDEAFVKQFPIQNVPFPVADPEYCHHLIKLLTWESSFVSSNSESSISHLFRVLFSKLYESTLDAPASTHTQALISLRKRIYNNPELSWNIGQMAEELHLSTSRLQTLYKKMFHSSCMDDVIEGRLRLAQDRLKYTTKPIGEIAENCGYSNVEHFCRQFKQYLKCTPGQYRKRTAQPATGVNTHSTLGGKEMHILTKTR